MKSWNGVLGYGAFGRRSGWGDFRNPTTNRFRVVNENPVQPQSDGLLKLGTAPDGVRQHFQAQGPGPGHAGRRNPIDIGCDLSNTPLQHRRGNPNGSNGIEGADGPLQGNYKR